MLRVPPSHHDAARGHQAGDFRASLKHCEHASPSGRFSLFRLFLPRAFRARNRNVSNFGLFKPVQVKAKMAVPGFCAKA
jgi:hypothetical protein